VGAIDRREILVLTSCARYEEMRLLLLRAVQGGSHRPFVLESCLFCPAKNSSIIEIAPAGEYSPTVFHLHAEMGLYLVTSIAPICFCCLFIAGSVGRKVRYLCPNNTPWKSEHRLPPGTSSRGITQQNRGGHRSPRNSYLRNKRPLCVARIDAFQPIFRAGESQPRLTLLRHVLAVRGIDSLGSYCSVTSVGVVVSLT
jgi:hypothetical protein